MSITVKILNQRRYEPVLKIPGLSLKPFVFRWDAKKCYYSCEVDTQAQLDDLMDSQQFSNHYRFSVIMPDFKPAEPTVEIREIVKEVTKLVPIEATALVPRDRPPLPFNEVELSTKSREELKSIAARYGLAYSPALKIDAIQNIIAAFIQGYDGKMPQ